MSKTAPRADIKQAHSYKHQTFTVHQHTFDTLIRTTHLRRSKLGQDPSDGKTFLPELKQILEKLNLKDSSRVRSFYQYHQRTTQHLCVYLTVANMTEVIQEKVLSLLISRARTGVYFRSTCVNSSQAPMVERIEHEVMRSEVNSLNYLLTPISELIVEFRPIEAYEAR